MARRRSASAAAILAVVLVIAGCATPPVAANPTPASETSAQSSTSPTPAPTTPAEPTASAPPAAGVYVDYADGVIETTAGTKVLFFHASWCPQCRALDEDLRANGVPAGLTVFKVDFDSRSDLRQKYGVTLQTTVVFVDDSGELVSSSVLYDDPSVASLVAAIP